MLKKLLVALGILFLLIVVACSGDSVAGGTTDPNAIAEKMSSSLEANVRTSSSEETDVVEEMSSSSQMRQIHDTIFASDTILSSSSYYAWNFSAQCMTDNVDVPGPTAYKSVEGDSINVYLEAVPLNAPCNLEEDAHLFEEFYSGIRVPLELESDTLQMIILQMRMDETCTCAARVSFTINKPNSDFNYFILNQWSPIPIQER